MNEIKGLFLPRTLVMHVCILFLITMLKSIFNLVATEDSRDINPCKPER